MEIFLTFAIVVYCLGQLAVTFFDQIEDSTATCAFKMIISATAFCLILAGALVLNLVNQAEKHSMKKPSAQAPRTAPRR